MKGYNNKKFEIQFNKKKLNLISIFQYFMEYSRSDIDFNLSLISCTNQEGAKNSF